MPIIQSLKVVDDFFETPIFEEFSKFLQEEFVKLIHKMNERCIEAINKLDFKLVGEIFAEFNVTNNETVKIHFTQLKK